MRFDGFTWQQKGDRLWGYDMIWCDGPYYRFGFWLFAIHWHFE